MVVHQTTAEKWFSLQIPPYQRLGLGLDCVRFGEKALVWRDPARRLGFIFPSAVNFWNNNLFPPQADAGRGWSWCMVMVIFFVMVVLIVGLYFILTAAGVVKGAGKSTAAAAAATSFIQRKWF